MLIQNLSELPNFQFADKVYLDLETTSRDPAKKSVNPWHTCHLLGVAISVDNCTEVYYIPVEHNPLVTQGLYHNVDKDCVIQWLKDVLLTSRYWINHNIKYDAHVLKNDCNIDVATMPIVLCDTLSRIKMIDSDRFNYNLTFCAKEYLYEDISPLEKRLKTELGKKQDYGYVPIDTMHAYACKDVDATRRLNEYCEQMLPPECRFIWDIETQITKILYCIENEGLTCDQRKLAIDYFAYPQVLQTLCSVLEKKMGGMRFSPTKQSNLEELICTKMGLPIIEWTEKGKPSFGHDALISYMGMKDVDVDTLATLLQFKELYKLYTSFTVPYIELMCKDGKIHSDYNQIVRTGRMSVRNPNAQQLSPEAKEYIIPSANDRMLVEYDLSQVEFRTIAHYINATECIRSYNEDPKTDFHSWVANMCNIPRKPAKNINFMLGYGGGEQKCLSMLKALPDIVGELHTTHEIEERAQFVFNSYHKALPTLKPTRWKASTALRQQGFVRTFFKRRRHIPYNKHFIAFNTVCQGTAADLMKIITTKVWEYIKDKDIKLIGIVHDSWLFDAPQDVNPQILEDIHNTICYTPEGFRVPIYADSKQSTKNWRME